MFFAAIILRRCKLDIAMSHLYQQSQSSIRMISLPAGMEAGLSLERSKFNDSYLFRNLFPCSDSFSRRSVNCGSHRLPRTRDSRCDLVRRSVCRQQKLRDAGFTVWAFTAGDLKPKLRGLRCRRNICFRVTRLALGNLIWRTSLCWIS